MADIGLFWIIFRTKYTFWSNKVKVLTWPIEMLWHDLKKATLLCNMTVLQLFWKEEWFNITPDYCARLICNYRSCLVEFRSPLDKFLLTKREQPVIKCICSFTYCILLSVIVCMFFLFKTCNCRGIFRYFRHFF